MSNKIGVVRVAKFTKWTLLKLAREILRDLDTGVNPEAKLTQMKEAYRKDRYGWLMRSIGCAGNIPEFPSFSRISMRTQRRGTGR